MARRLELDPIAARLADAKARLETEQQKLDELTKQYQVFQQSAADVNAKGVEVHKAIIGIEGEIKALSALVK